MEFLRYVIYEHSLGKDLDCSGHSQGSKELSLLLKAEIRNLREENVAKDVNHVTDKRGVKPQTFMTLHDSTNRPLLISVEYSSNELKSCTEFCNFSVKNSTSPVMSSSSNLRCSKIEPWQCNVL